jgi:hypothetical protein
MLKVTNKTTQVKDWREYEVFGATTWTCIVQADDDVKFKRWMNDNCPTANVNWIFNNGHTQFTVHITDEKEMVNFSLRWI